MQMGYFHIFFSSICGNSIIKYGGLRYASEVSARRSDSSLLSKAVDLISTLLEHCDE